MKEKYRWNYDIKIKTSEGEYIYENEPLENIGKRANQHPNYSEVRAVHRKVLVRKPIQMKGGKTKLVT